MSDLVYRVSHSVKLFFSVVRAIKMLIPLQYVRPAHRFISPLGSLHNCKLNDGNSAFGQAENVLIFGRLQSIRVLR